MAIIAINETGKQQGNNAPGSFLLGTCAYKAAFGKGTRNEHAELSN